MSARRLYSPAKTLAALVGFSLLVLLPYLRTQRAPQDYAFGGLTMGTTYNVRIAQSRLSERSVHKLQAGVEALLVEINRQMSTYDPDSVISQFNRHTNATPFAVPADFARVTAGALELAASTRGAFDPTVFPLVALWGFGPIPNPEHRPAPEAIAATLHEVGFTNVVVTPDGTLIKRHPNVQLDLNALAPGYAVDRMAQYLREQGCPDVFVELSGEVMASGNSAPGHPWRVAIETPDFNAPVASSLYRRLDLSNRAIATSGDYRKFFEQEGQVFSHVLDPRHGYPVSNGVTSASVLAPDCMTADGAATALMVMGVEEGLRWIESQAGLEALVLVRNPDSTYAAFASSGFPP